MKEVPAKVEHNKAWVVIKLGIAEDRIVLPDPVNQEILYKTVVDLAERKNTLIITFKTQAEGVVKVKSVDKVLEILKKLILNSCNAYRLAAYFKSPAIRGGVLIQGAPWEKGSIVVVRTGIWFVSPAKQVCVPLMDAAAIELTKTEVQGKPTDIICIDHVDAGEVVSSQVLCPISTLQVLFNFLKDATKGMDMKGNELDAVGQQVAMLVYSGMDSHAIENMLNIPHKELDAIYDRILNLQLGEVVAVRREIQLTTKGVRYISDATKSQVK
ncbi:MAG: Chemotaxis signal transduction system protein F from archaea [Methanoregula sp. PtaU1.Bin051]|nr:MAG: Chemotaxis signal transduction system protein F from archaea [Methanoregula sp. PtaU1.Bin051]